MAIKTFTSDDEKLVVEVIHSEDRNNIDVHSITYDGTSIIHYVDTNEFMGIGGCFASFGDTLDEIGFYIDNGDTFNHFFDFNPWGVYGHGPAVGILTPEYLATKGLTNSPEFSDVTPIIETAKSIEFTNQPSDWNYDPGNSYSDYPGQETVFIERDDWALAVGHNRNKIAIVANNVLLRDSRFRYIGNNPITGGKVNRNQYDPSRDLEFELDPVGNTSPWLQMCGQGGLFNYTKIVTYSGDAPWTGAPLIAPIDIATVSQYQIDTYPLYPNQGNTGSGAGPHITWLPTDNGPRPTWWRRHDMAFGVTQISAGHDWCVQDGTLSENWIAMVDDNDYGIASYSPTNQTTKRRSVGGGIINWHSIYPDQGYSFLINQSYDLTAPEPGEVTENRATEYLIFGHIDEIRATIYNVLKPLHPDIYTGLVEQSPPMGVINGSLRWVENGYESYLDSTGTKVTELTPGSTLIWVGTDGYDHWTDANGIEHRVVDGVYQAFIDNRWSWVSNGMTYHDDNGVTSFDIPATAINHPAGEYLGNTTITMEHEGLTFYYTIGTTEQDTPDPTIP